MSIEAIYQAVLDYQKDEIGGLVTGVLENGGEPVAILNEGLIAPMDEVGKRFGEGYLFIPEMLRAAQTMKAGLEVLKPLLVESETQPRGIVVLGTVKGDLHDIGKNLVKMMLEGGGFQVVDLGVDVPSAKFVEAVKENRVHIVGLSALLTTTMPAMKETLEKVKAENPAVLVMVGGAPVTREYAESIGADAYAADAAEASRHAKEMVVQP